jgi:L-threonylcarbamoyladenylate synthase
MNPQQPGTIGIRIPAHDFALDLLRHTKPLATTSANLSGSPPLTTLAAIHETFPAVGVPGPELLPTTHDLGSGQPSTVAKWTQNDWHILRQGSIVLSH